VRLLTALSGPDDWLRGPFKHTVSLARTVSRYCFARNSPSFSRFRFTLLSLFFAFFRPVGCSFSHVMFVAASFLLILLLDTLFFQFQLFQQMILSGYAT
jgi:hypothetical protein